MRTEEITIDVKAKGLDKVTQQLQDLHDTMSTPQVLIRNCENCVFNIHPSQTTIITGDDEEEGESDETPNG